MTVNFEQILDDSLNTLNMKPGSLVTGIVMDILDNYVVVHVGLKSEASVPINEFYDESGELAVEVGDEVQLTLEAVEDGHGNKIIVDSFNYELKKDLLKIKNLNLIDKNNHLNISNYIDELYAL